MRKTMFASLIVLMFGVCCLAYAQSKSGADAAGIWAGTWTGGSTGKFEMTVKKGADGKLAGSLTASPDQGESYTTAFKSVVAEGNKLTIKFDDPAGEVEVTLVATIESSSMKGDYSVRAKANGEEVDKGAFAGSKK
jgi:hypothetical protein